MDGGDRRADPDLRRRPARDLNTLEHQPGKGNGDGRALSKPSGRRAVDPLGIPNSAEKRVDYALEIPKLSSLILKHSLDAPLAGSTPYQRTGNPRVAIVFWSVSRMVAIGFAMLPVSASGASGVGCAARSTRVPRSTARRAHGPGGLRGSACRLESPRRSGGSPTRSMGTFDGGLDSRSQRRLWAPARRLHHRLFLVSAPHLLHPAADGTPAAMRGPDLDEGPLRTAGVTPGRQQPTREAIMAIDLPLIWAAIIAFAVSCLCRSRRFDLGVGILFPFSPKSMIATS